MMLSLDNPLHVTASAEFAWTPETSYQGNRQGQMNPSEQTMVDTKLLQITSKRQRACRINQASPQRDSKDNLLGNQLGYKGVFCSCSRDGQRRRCHKNKARLHDFASTKQSVSVYQCFYLCPSPCLPNCPTISAFLSVSIYFQQFLLLCCGCVMGKLPSSNLRICFANECLLAFQASHLSCMSICKLNG